MKKEEIIKLIPFGIAVILTLISIFQTVIIPNMTDENGTNVRYVIDDSILYACFGLIIVLIFIIQQKTYWKHAFGILLLIALTSVIRFFYVSLSIGIGFLQLELVALGLLIFHLILNKEVLNNTLELFKESEEKTNERTENKIKNFEEKFVEKDKNELQKIVDENDLIPEAVEAAKRLLNKKPA